MELKDKLIVITGAARGIGAAIARELAGEGANLALVDLSPEMTAETSKSCQALGSTVRCYGANVALESDVEAVFEQIARDFGQIDGLVNNAGITRDALLVKAKDGKVISKMSLDYWQSVIDVNLTGVFLCGREAAAKMIELNTPGVIVNISSISQAGNMGQTNYAAAKAGVTAMTVTWARELARYGIRVGAVAPGFINTDLVAAMKPEAREKLTSGIPRRRLGEAGEISHSVRFIFENDYFSGRCIAPDGGLRL